MGGRGALRTESHVSPGIRTSNAAWPSFFVDKLYCSFRQNTRDLVQGPSIFFYEKYHPTVDGRTIPATGAQGPLAVHIVIGEKPLLVLFGYGPTNALLERLLESDR